jgi:hypothetical protein
MGVFQGGGRHHYRWKRERLVSSHGFAKVRVGRGHPLADPNGYAYEHLVVWVSAGNLRPGRGEVFKFRNGDRADCRIENLYLVSRSEHNRLKNAATLRDDLGRLMSARVSGLVRAGARLRTVRAKR